MQLSSIELLWKHEFIQSHLSDQSQKLHEFMQGCGPGPSLREILQLDEVQTLRYTDSLNRLMEIHLLLYPHQVKPCFPHTMVADRVPGASFKHQFGQDSLCSQGSTAKLTGPASCCEFLSQTACLGNTGLALIAAFGNTANHKSPLPRLLIPTLP